MDEKTKDENCYRNVFKATHEVSGWARTWTTSVASKASPGTTKDTPALTRSEAVGPCAPADHGNQNIHPRRHEKKALFLLGHKRS